MAKQWQENSKVWQGTVKAQSRSGQGAAKAQSMGGKAWQGMARHKKVWQFGDAFAAKGMLQN